MNISKKLSARSQRHRGKPDLRKSTRQDAPGRAISDRGDRWTAGIGAVSARWRCGGGGVVDDRKKKIKKKDLGLDSVNEPVNNTVVDNRHGDKLMATYGKVQPLRLDKEHEGSLDIFAREMSGKTGNADVIRSLLPRGPWVHVLADEVRTSPDPEGKSIFDCMAALACEGLIRRMQGHAKPVDKYFTTCMSPDDIAAFYLTFLEAVRFDLGLVEVAAYHFEKPPAGGQWEELGVTGYGVLAADMHFTANGYEQVVEAK